MKGKNMQKKQKRAPVGYHYMPDGTLMRGAPHNAANKKKVRQPINPKAAAKSKKRKVQKRSGY